MPASNPFVRTMPINSPAPVEAALTDGDGTIVDGTTAYLLEVYAERSTDGTGKVFNQTATGADDTANTPRVFWDGNPADGNVIFYPPSSWRDTENATIVYRFRVYRSATVYDVYPEGEPITEIVIGHN